MVVLENPDANEHCKFISFPIIVHKFLTLKVFIKEKGENYSYKTSLNIDSYNFISNYIIYSQGWPRGLGCPNLS